MPPSRLGVSPEPRVTCEHGWWVPGEPSRYQREACNHQRHSEPRRAFWLRCTTLRLDCQSGSRRASTLAPSNRAPIRLELIRHHVLRLPQHTAHHRSLGLPATTRSIRTSKHGVPVANGPPRLLQLSSSPPPPTDDRIKRPSGSRFGGCVEEARRRGGEQAAGQITHPNSSYHGLRGSSLAVRHCWSTSQSS